MSGELLIIMGGGAVVASSGHPDGSGQVMQAEGVIIIPSASLRAGMPHNRTTLVKRYPQGLGVCTERSRNIAANNVDAPFIVSDCSEMII